MPAVLVRLVDRGGKVVDSVRYGVLGPDASYSRDREERLAQRLAAQPRQPEPATCHADADDDRDADSHGHTRLMLFA